jgi:hypothetical protein
MIIRSESRVVRPFSGLEHATELLRSSQILIDSSSHSSGTVVLPDSQFKSAILKFDTGTTLKELQKACKAANVPPKSTKYVLLARSRMLRRSTLVYEHTISREGFDETFEIDRLAEDKFVFNDQTGFKLTAALVLCETLTPKPLQVTDAGTWLASSHFNIRPQNDKSSFSPLPLDKAAREKFGLRPGTYSYIDIQDDLLVLDDLGSAITAYLDEDVLNLLLSNESDSTSEAVQTQFAIQTLFAITQAISLEMDSQQCELQDLSSDSAALNFIMRLSEECKVDANDVLEQALRNQSSLTSLIESKFNYAKKIGKLLKGTE